MISPDGYYYLRTGPIPRPYALRWLLPTLLGPRPGRWTLLTYVSLALVPVGAWLAFAQLPWDRRAFAVALLCCLPGVRQMARYPVLTDAPAFALALLTAAHPDPWGQVAFALVLGSIRETGPVFAACWAWSPWPLIGLLTVGWWRRYAPPDSIILARPWRSAREARKAIGLDASFYARPFGASLAGLVVVTPQLALTLLLAHAQLLLAVDTVRLTVWCAPVLVFHAANVLPSPVWLIALALTLFTFDPRT